MTKLEYYADLMGAEVCRKAIDVALDEKKTTWSYVRAILAGAAEEGVRCLADWNARQERRSAARKGKTITAACDGKVGSIEKHAVQKLMEGGEF